MSRYDIAIIGIAARFSKADNIEEFWKIIKSGKTCVDEFPEKRKKDYRQYINFKKELTEFIEFIPASYISDISGFDYNFFKLTPKQAALMDPNHRLLLENIYHALEDSGYGEEKLYGSKTGVYIGFTKNPTLTYGDIISDVEPESIPFSVTGNLPGFIPSKISML